MSEFSSEVKLIAKPDPASIRSTKSEIESGLDDIEIPVSADVQGASSRVAGGSGSVGGRSTMSRQLAGGRSNDGGQAIEYLEQGTELDMTRNELLRELINETESGNFTRAKGGRLGMLGGALGLAGVGLAIGPAIAGKVGDALSGVGDSISEVTGDVEASELVTGVVGASSLITGSVTAGTLITGSLPASALITGAVSASSLITGEVSPGSFIGSVSAGGLIDGVEASALLTAVSATAVLNPVGASAVLTSVGVGTLIDGTLHPSEFVDGTISASDLVDVPGEGIDLESVLIGAGGAAGSAAIASRLVQGSGSTAAGASAGVASPVLTPEMFPEDSAFRTNPMTGREVEPSILTAEGRHDRLGGFGQWLNRQLGTQFNQSARVRGQQPNSSTDSARERADRRGGSSVEMTNQIDVGRRSDREIERIIDRRLKEFRRQLERDFSNL